MGEVEQGFDRMAGGPERRREALDDHQAELEAQKTELEQALVTLDGRNAHIDLVRRFGDEMVAEGSSVETVAVGALRDRQPLDLRDRRPPGADEESVKISRAVGRERPRTCDP